MKLYYCTEGVAVSLQSLCACHCVGTIRQYYCILTYKCCRVIANVYAIICFLSYKLNCILERCYYPAVGYSVVGTV